MFNEVNLLKSQMRQLRGSIDDNSNQTFDVYANRSMPQSVQLRLQNQDHQIAPVVPQRIPVSNVFVAEHNNILSQRYHAGSERMSVASGSNQQPDFQPSQAIDRPTTRRGRQTSARASDFGA